MLEELKSIMPRSLKGWGIFIVVMVWLPQILYDHLLKPGFGGISAWAFDVLALTFKKFRDSAYTNAALDPTAVPSLYLLLFVTTVPIGLFTMAMTRMMRAQEKHNSFEGMSVNEVNDEIAHIKKRLIILRCAFFVTGLIGIGLLLSQFILINRSVAVWRSFNADIISLSPHLSESEEKQIRSQFSQMRSEADYALIIKVLTSRAKPAKLVLTSSLD